MTQEKQGKIPVTLPDLPVDGDDILRNGSLPVPAVAQKAAPAALVHRRVRGFAVAPLIRRPYFKPRFAEPPGKPFVPEGMFRHAMHNVEHPPLFHPGIGEPAP
jgi:hypothetical protein